MFLIYFLIKFCFRKIIIGVEKPLNQGVRHGNNVSSKKNGHELLLNLIGERERGAYNAESTKREPFCAEDGFGMVCVKKGSGGDNVFLSIYCLSVGRPVTTTPKMYS